MEGPSSRFIWESGDLAIYAPYRIESGPRHVRAWAPFRPPFEPRPDSAAARFRAELRLAVSTLTRETESEILRCRYASSVAGLVDTENVLIYNLGPSHLAAAGKRGVRFLRTFDEPPASPVALDPAGPVHYLEYGFSEASSTESIPTGEVLARWTDVPWPSGRGVPWVSALVTALRSSPPQVYGRLGGLLARFGVRVEINSTSPVLNPVMVLKPLLDAVVSAFHGPTRAADPAVIAHVARQVGTADTDSIAGLLNDDAFNVLGKRAFVGLYRKAVKWDPADDRCVLGQVVVVEREGAASFSGEIFAIGSS